MARVYVKPQSSSAMKVYITNLSEKSIAQAALIVDAAMVEVADKAKAEILSNHINPPTIKKDGITLVDTGEYVEKIHSRRVSQRLWYIGLPDGVHASGVSYRNMWMWLRYGTARMPARPHIDTAFGTALKIVIDRLRASGFKVKG